MTRRGIKRTATLGTALLGGLALGVVGVVPAMAHVTVSADEATAGSYAVLTFSVPHGCEGSSTTRVSIQVPDGINAVTPTRNAPWEVDKVMEDLETPIEDSHGTEVTERVAEVVYTTEDPLPEGYRDAFELSLQLPEEWAETTVPFPTVQTCEEGEAAWVQVPADGQEPDELELPAPALEVGAAQDGGEHPRSEEEQAEPEEGQAGSEEAAADTSDGSNLLPWVIISLVFGAAGLLAGGAAWLRGRPGA